MYEWLSTAQEKVGKSMNVTTEILDLLEYQTNCLKPNKRHPESTDSGVIVNLKGSDK